MALLAAYENGMLVLDVGNPAAPKKRGSLKTKKAVCRIRVQGTEAMLALGGLDMVAVDVSNPDAPTAHHGEQAVDERSRCAGAAQSDEGGDPRAAAGKGQERPLHARVARVLQLGAGRTVDCESRSVRRHHRDPQGAVVARAELPEGDRRVLLAGQHSVLRHQGSDLSRTRCVSRPSGTRDRPLAWHGRHLPGQARHRRNRAGHGAGVLSERVARRRAALRRPRDQ